MKVIIFGGAGFLGSHVADSLIDRGHEVTIYDLIPYNYENSPKMIIGDIMDRAAVSEAVSGADAVYNFAGVADLDDAINRLEDTINLNILGNYYLMEACVQHQVKRYVYASTLYVHSDKGGFYRCSKQASEIYLEEFNRTFGLPYTVLRYGSLYGPRSDEHNGFYRFVKSAMTKGEIRYSGTGEELREYIHVKDAANLSARILDEEFENKHVIITGQTNYRVHDILTTIGEVLDKPLKIEFANEEKNLHYNVTPFVYKPQSSYKLTPTYYHDIGQGIFECATLIGEELGEL
jgi:UDP-glucose 4-epimerase